jgi:23S rRNA pseudouridine2457 synthase
LLLCNALPPIPVHFCGAQPLSCLETRNPEFETPGVLIAFNKPFGVLSQFTPDHPGQRTLADFGFPKDIYPIGRLDADSEGLLLLSDESELNERLLHPRHAHEREYWAQVERIPTAETLQKLSRGVLIQGRKTLPCRVWLLNPQPAIVGDDVRSLHLQEGKTETPHVVSYSPERSATRPALPPRDPPIRFRKNVPDCWIGLKLVEGKNRQVRRMTAAIGHPTLRLIRIRIGGLRLENLPPGKWKEMNREERQNLLQ